MQPPGVQERISGGMRSIPGHFRKRWWWDGDPCRPKPGGDDGAWRVGEGSQRWYRAVRSARRSLVIFLTSKRATNANEGFTAGLEVGEARSEPQPSLQPFPSPTASALSTACPRVSIPVRFLLFVSHGSSLSVPVASPWCALTFFSSSSGKYCARPF